MKSIKLNLSFFLCSQVFDALEKKETKQNKPTNQQKQAKKKREIIQAKTRKNALNKKKKEETIINLWNDNDGDDSDETKTIKPAISK